MIYFQAAIGTFRMRPASVLSGSVFLIALCGACGAIGAPDATREEVLVSWETRRARIRSCQYKCELERATMIPKPGNSAQPPTAASSQDQSADAVILRGTVAFSLSGEKIAYSREGERWDDATSMRQIERIRNVYDGGCAKSLIECGSILLGEMSTHPRARELLTRNTELTAFWFSVSPLMLLEEIGYRPRELTVGDVEVFRNGHSCVELTMSAVEAPNRVAIVCVDPSRDFLPLELAQTVDGVAFYRCSIQHTPDPDLGWRPSQLMATQFGPSGSVSISWLNRVTGWTVNSPIPDEPFSLDFPEGTHVVAGDSLFSSESFGAENEYSIQLADGKRQAISAEEFGRFPSDPPDAKRPLLRVLGILIFALTLGAICFVLWKRRPANMSTINH